MSPHSTTDPPALAPLTAERPSARQQLDSAYPTERASTTKRVVMVESGTQTEPSETDSDSGTDRPTGAKQTERSRARSTPRGSRRARTKRGEGKAAGPPQHVRELRSGAHDRKIARAAEHRREEARALAERDRPYRSREGSVRGRSEKDRRPRSDRSSSASSSGSSGSDDESEEETTHAAPMKVADVRTLRNWQLKFSGDEHENAVEFSASLGDCRSQMDYEYREFLRAIPCILTRFAARWFRSSRGKIHSWSSFKRAFRHQFIGEIDREDLYEEICRRGKGERITKFLESFAYLVSHFKRKPSERKQKKMVFRLILPEYRRFLIGKRIETVSDIERYGRKLKKLWEIDCRYAPPPAKDKMRVPDAAYTAKPRTCKVAAAEESDTGRRSADDQAVGPDKSDGKSKGKKSKEGKGGKGADPANDVTVETTPVAAATLVAPAPQAGTVPRATPQRPQLAGRGGGSENPGAQLIAPPANTPTNASMVRAIQAPSPSFAGACYRYQETVVDVIFREIVRACDFTSAGRTAT